MTRAELKAARARRLNRLAQQRWRAKQPKAANNDGLETFDLPVYPPPVIVPQSVSSYVPQKSEADALVEALPPLPPPPDPLIFDRSADRYRPAWVREMDPNPAPIRLTADPRVAYRFGAGLIEHQAAETAKEEEAERAALAKSQDRRAWAPGQTEEEL